MAQVVQTDRAHTRGLGQLVELIGDVLRRVGLSVLASENETVFDVCLTPLGSFHVLSEAVSQQNARGVRVDTDHTIFTAGRLRLTELELSVLAFAELALNAGSVDLHELLTNDDSVLVQVHVIPTQPAGLTAAQSRHSHRLVQRAESVGGRMVEELAQLLGLPRLHLRTSGARQFEVLGSIERHEMLALR
ncbi:hypothetical protein AN948_32715 [Rhodococcus sp. ADH]|nr:hypothetical protein AN948_32715 [Rhodococcus sp. ADH]